MSKKVAIIGGGSAGVASAYEFSKKKNWEVSLFEKSNNLGAGVWTNFKSGHPFTYGPRHFLTHNENVFNYMNEIVPMRLCAEHQFMSYIEEDANFYNYPIHEDDIPKMPDAKIINDQINNLDEFYKDREFKLQVGNEDLEKKANNYEEFWIRSIGNNLYNKFVKDYTKKCGK